MGDIKIYDIEPAIEKFDIKYFVETGTLNGDAIAYILKEFPLLERYISFEIMPSLAEAASKKFHADKRVEIVLGDSAKILRDKIETLDGNILFWLDAHFPGADAALRMYGDEKDPNKNLPLEKEIEAIAERAGKYQDVIIIDDLWIYEDGDYEWGTFDDHMKRHGHDIRREDLKCGDASFIRDAFANTHDIKTVNKFQGSLVLTPNP